MTFVSQPSATSHCDNSGEAAFANPVPMPAPSFTINSCVVPTRRVPGFRSVLFSIRTYSGSRWPMARFCSGLHFNAAACPIGKNLLVSRSHFAIFSSRPCHAMEARSQYAQPGQPRRWLNSSSGNLKIARKPSTSRITHAAKYAHVPDDDEVLAAMNGVEKRHTKAPRKVPHLETTRRLSY